MYWRIRKRKPLDLAKHYGIHVALVLSVFFNLFMLARLNASKALTEEQKHNFGKFASQVSGHLLDGSYLTYERSMQALLSPELGPSVVAALQAKEELPKTPEEIKAIARALKEKKAVSCMRVDSIDVGDSDGQGLVPISVKGAVVGHSAEGLNGPRGFHFKFMVGLHKDTKEPIVAGFEELPLAVVID